MSMALGQKGCHRKTQSGKAVFGVEYELEPEQFCLQANTDDFDFLKENWDLAA
jgi:hypothetical protein